MTPLTIQQTIVGATENCKHVAAVQSPIFRNIWTAENDCRQITSCLSREIQPDH